MKFKFKKSTDKHWAAKNYWNYEEAAFLLNGIEPIAEIEGLYEMFRDDFRKYATGKAKKIIDTRDLLMEMFDKPIRSPCDANVVREYSPYRIFREIYNRGVIKVTINPELFRLVNERHIREHRDELILDFTGVEECVETCPDNFSPSDFGEDDTSLSSQATRKYNNVLKLVAAMAKIGYGKTNLMERGFSQELVIDMEKIGHPLSDDTVRGILEKAALHIGDLPSDS